MNFKNYCFNEAHIIKYFKDKKPSLRIILKKPQTVKLEDLISPKTDDVRPEYKLSQQLNLKTNKFMSVMDNDNFLAVFVFNGDAEEPFLCYFKYSNGSLSYANLMGLSDVKTLWEKYTIGEDQKSLLAYNGEVRIKTPIVGAKEYNHPKGKNYFFDNFNEPDTVYLAGDTVFDELVYLKQWDEMSDDELSKFKDSNI